MGSSRMTRKQKFGTPERQPHLRIICATIGPGKSQLLALIEERHSISEAARQMKMSYKRAWKLIEAMNGCFRKPLVESITGGSHGGGSRLSPLGKQVLMLYGAICAKSHASGARELKRLHGLLKTSV
jgi:molybdate transport system regulatory protein